MIDETQYKRAERFVMSKKTVRSAQLQVKLGLGWEVAARLLERMEARGIVGPLKRGEPRRVLKYKLCKTSKSLSEKSVTKGVS